MILLVAGLVMAGLIAAGMLTWSGPAFAAEETGEVNNGIPVVYLEIDESQGTIEAMNASPDHSVYCYGELSISVPEGFHYCDMPDAACESVEGLSMSIRGRGNTTWSEDKKPYKIKLDKKADLFGLGKNKHWVLLANANDPSLLRDRITAWLGDQIGFEFTPRGVPVDLVMNGKYLGSYYFSENVRVDDNRVQLDELTQADEDPQVITGGYLVQCGTQELGSPNVFATDRDEIWATHTPSFDVNDDGYENPAQEQYIQGYLQRVEDALYGENFTNSAGEHYRDLMDLDSAVKYWLVDQACLNGDGYGTGSTYIYKKRDSEAGPGKLYWGPLWDFDYAWDYDKEYEGYRIMHGWIKAMLHDDEPGGFIEESEAQWPQVSAALKELTASGGIIDQYYEETKASALADHVIHSSKKDSAYDYHEKTEHLKKWIIDRTAWLDKNIANMGKQVYRITYMNGNELCGIEYMEQGDSLYGTFLRPEREGFTQVGWSGDDGQMIDERAGAEGDMTLHAEFKPDSELTHGEDILFVLDHDTINLLYQYGEYDLLYSVVPADAQDKSVIWTSSNESIATVDPDGGVHVLRTGEVTITGRLKYGETRSFRLMVLNQDVTLPEAVAMDQQTYTMNVNEYSKIRLSCQPEDSHFEVFTFTTDDNSVAKVDETGLLHAVAPGKTKVHVEAYGFDYKKKEDIRHYATAIVNVRAGDTPNPITAKGRPVSLKASKLAKKTVKIKPAKAFKINRAQGRLSYKAVSVKPAKYKKYFKVDARKGTITVKKGLGKKLKKSKKTKTIIRLKVRVKDAGTAQYQAAQRLATVKLKVRR